MSTHLSADAPTSSLLVDALVVDEGPTTDDALRASEERFRLLVESVTDYALYMLDPRGHVTTWNAGAARVKGYAASEIVGRSFSVFFTPEDVAAGKPQRELEAAVEHGRFEEESTRVRRDGTLFWANVVITPVRGARGELLGFAKVTRDLTARRQKEEVERALHREQLARNAAEEANRMKDEFLATVSHEIRTPLNAILGWAALLRDPAAAASVPKGLEVIHRNAQAQASLIDDILDVSRIITGKLRIDVRPTNLVAIVGEAVEVVRPAAAAKQIALVWNRPAPLVMPLDPDRMRQVAWNLLSNAVKFTPAGGRVTVDVEAEPAHVTLTVADDGRGIEPAFLPHVFERFRQADGSSTRAIGGLGLGLAIVHHIVELHGGDAFAESAGPGLGATFRVVLPLEQASLRAASSSDERRSPASSPASLEGVNVLVVEDDGDARELLQDVLGAAGARVVAISSVAEALGALDAALPDVIISDVAMPVEDGYAFARRIRSRAATDGGEIPMLALTSHTRADDRRRATGAGFTAHLGKPVVPSDLVSVIARLARPRSP